MPRGGYDEDYDFGGPPGYDEAPRTSNHKSRGNDDKGKGMEVARRGKAKKYSDSEDDEPKKKSKSKSKKKSKKRRDSDDEDEDDDEVIVTKTAKYKDVDIRDIAGEYLDALTRVFEVRVEKIERWCHDGLIRLDNQTGMFDADKLIKQKASEDEKKEWERYEKKYKRMMKENKEMWEGKGGHGGSSRPVVVVTQYSGPPRFDGSACYVCARLGAWCGHQI